MACVNPVLAQDGQSNSLFPVPQPGENFILKRDDISFECTLPGGAKLWGKGLFFLSTKRIVFLAEGRKNRPDFVSFGIPLDKFTAKPKFEQPIFGANYVSGAVALDAAQALGGGVVPFSLTFIAGGCGKFLPIFYNLVLNPPEQESVAQAAEDGRIGQVATAYVDPTDPSVLYLSQPTPVPDSEQTTEFQPTQQQAPSGDGGTGAAATGMKKVAGGIALGLLGGCVVAICAAVALG